MWKLFIILTLRVVIDMVLVKLKCFSCSAELSFPAGIARRDECEQCGADVHVCKNCRFYDENSHNECREPSAEVEREKERANFCDYFEAGDGAGSGEVKEGLLAAAEALFKK